MIDLNDWPIMARLILVMGPFIFGLPGPLILAFLVLGSDYDVARSGIRSNPFIESMKQVRREKSFKWRWMLICMLAGLVTFPKFALRRGMLDPDELKRFPSRLKIKMAVAAWLTLVGCVWMVVAYAVILLSEVR